MREWTEKHILELIEKTAAQQGISQPSGGVPDYGFGLVNDHTLFIGQDQLLNVLMVPQLNPGGNMDGTRNYAFAYISKPVMLVDYYSGVGGKTIDGNQAQRPYVEVVLGIKLTNKAVGPYDNTVIGYVIDQPIKISNSLIKTVDGGTADERIVATKDIPTLQHLNYSPLNLLNFTGENGEIVSCTETTLTGEYQVYNSQQDYEDEHVTSKFMQVPAYEIRVTCGELVGRLSPSAGTIKGVVQL